MSQSKKQRAQELLNLQLPASEQLNNESTSSENYPIEGSPLWVRCREEKWFLTMGNHRLTKPVDTKEECMKKLDEEFWQILITIVGIAIEKYHDKETNSIYGDKSQSPKN